MVRFFLLLPVIFLTFTPLLAATIHVPDDYETIQTAIDSSSDGDLVLVERGVYEELVNFRGKNITVASRFIESNDPEDIVTTVIDGSNERRCVRFANGESEEAHLIGFTIRNGTASYGGGIYIYDTAPTLSYLLVYGNHATSNGGGIYCTTGATPTLDHITIFGNTGESNYGGINCFNGASAVIANSILFSNTPPNLPGSLTASYCDMEGGFDGGDNIIDQDPQFVDEDNYDFQLTINSPCVDSGDPDADPDADGSRTDMGPLSYAHLPMIGVAPLGFDFGALRLNNQVEDDIVISNIGVVDLNVEALTVMGEDSPFSIVNGGGEVTLAPGDNVTATVRFMPTEPGDYVDSIFVASDDPDFGVTYIRLVGTGLVPAPVIEVEPLEIDFGQVTLREAVHGTFTIGNSGDADLIISSISILEEQSPFSIAFNQELQVGPEEEVEFTVDFYALTVDGHFASLRIESNDSTREQVDIALTGNGVLPNRRYEFTDNTGQNHSFLILSCLVDGQSLEYGSELGIFTENDLCCGGDYWLGDPIGVAAWGDNDMTEAVDGWQDGDAFIIRVWDIQANQEIEPDVQIVEGDDHFHTNGITVVRLSSGDANEGFKVYVTNGWGMISAPVVPEVTDIIPLWRPVVERNHLIMLKDGSGRFYTVQRAYSNMQPWDFRQGYQVRGSALDSLDLGTDYVAENTTLPLRQYWNIIAYLPSQSMTPQVAFRDFADRITIVKDAVGRFYIPARDFSNMQPLRRGLGYQVRTTEEIDFVWSRPQQQIRSLTRAISDPTHFIAPQPTGISMSALLYGGDDLRDYEVGAFLPDGRLVGSAKLNGDGPWGMAVWGDDITTAAKDGAFEGEAISFTLYDGFAEVPATISWESVNAFKGDGLAIVNIANSEPIPDGLRLESAQPNPFNGRTTLAFSLPSESHISLTIYDTEGRKVSLAASGRYEAGRHHLAWNVDLLPSGIYIARLNVNGTILSTKLALMR